MRIALYTIVFCVSISLNGRGQEVPETETYFEGIFHYKYTLLDSSENEKSFPWQEAIEYHDKSHILIKLKANGTFEDNDIYLDSEKKELLKINNFQRKITKLEKREIEEVVPTEFKKIGEEDILNYRCDVYLIKYSPKKEYLKVLINYEPKPVSRTYFIAKDLKILNPEIFAQLQGNHNTLLFDGRFSGLALKVIEEFSNGDRIVIEPIKIEERDMQELIALPPYPIDFNK